MRFFTISPFGHRQAFSSTKGLIVVYLTDKDKENIANMHPDCHLYSQYDNEVYSPEEVESILSEIKEAL